MLKTVAVILIVIVSTTVGFLKANTYKVREKQLEQSVSLVEFLKIYLLERNMKVKEAFCSLSEIQILDELTFLKNIKENMNITKDFRKLYLSSLDDKGLKLTDEDKDILKSLGGIVGISEKSQQSVELDSIKSMLNKNLKIAKEQSEKNVVMYERLGFFCGVALGVMII